MKRGKNYKAAVAKVDSSVSYSYDDAIKMVKDISFAKFDETVDVAMKLTLKKSQTVRDTLVLPHQFKAGKKILVFAKGEKAKEAEEAGATFVGDTELVDKVKGGWLDFDICVATPDMMKDVGKLGPVLGRRGMMPNPKTGTVTMDVKGAIAELQKGRVEFRADKAGIVTLSVGKVSMDANKIKDNITLFVNEVLRKKPSDAKGDFVSSVAVSSTMGPGVRIVLETEE